MRKNGFTLIELLVVVAIIGILAAVGVVAYNGYTGAAKKAVTKANHKIILNTMVSQIQMCEVDSSLGLLDNKLNCSDIFTLTNNYGKVTSAMSSYFGSIIENAYSSSVPATHGGRYQGTCVSSGSQPQGWGGLNEQGVHHVAMGWVNNVITLYVDSCVEESGSALSSTYKLTL
jgi:prepilin-type N-terminal cleavage/methylation domain-containing protein